MKAVKSLYFILLLLLPCYAFAVNSPIDMLQTTSNQMISELNAKKATMKSNPNVVFNIVNRILLPHVDMNTMAKSVVGRTSWTSATASEQQAFTKQFTELLIRTYASALAGYTNQTVQFFPIRGGWEGQSQVNVQSQIVQPGGPPIPMSYRLVLQGNAWKVVDFSVDNVSIVENFRSQFSADLSQGGLAALTTKLTQHNAALANQNS